jgi:hypothetical protein
VRQTTELSRVKARIKALAEKTVSNGCTEAEAMAAADMVGQLLTRYLRLPMDALLTSVHAAGIDIDQQAVAVFLDAPEAERTSR